MNEKRWLPCEFHCHTLHSDGGFTVEQLMKTAAERKLCGICLTDHNTTSGWKETEAFPFVKVLKGIEWTTYFGHMLVLGCSDFVDWRDAVPDNIDEKMQAVREKGGLVGIAHPYQLGTPICTGGHWDYNVQDFSLVNYMEIWSEGCAEMNPANEKAKKKWLSLLSQGYHIAASFGRDWHRPEGNKLRGACTYLLCEGELDGEKMKSAIRNGKTQISLGPVLYVETDEGKTVGDTVSCGETEFRIRIDNERFGDFSDEYKLECEKIRVISKNGITVKEESCFAEKIILHTEENSFYVFELVGRLNEKENQLIAMTSPIYTY